MSSASSTASSCGVGLVVMALLLDSDEQLVKRGQREVLFLPSVRKVIYVASEAMQFKPEILNVSLKFFKCWGGGVAASQHGPLGKLALPVLYLGRIPRRIERRRKLPRLSSRHVDLVRRCTHIGGDKGREHGAERS